MTLIDRSAVHDPSWPNQVDIYDTTLRDGSQLEGISLTVDDKLRIAEQLDRLGRRGAGLPKPAAHRTPGQGRPPRSKSSRQHPSEHERASQLLDQLIGQRTPPHAARACIRALRRRRTEAADMLDHLR